MVFQAMVYAGWTFFGRAAGCAWDDNIDQDFDRKTARCRTRPIARGAISTTSAYIFTLMMIAFAFLFMSPLPAPCQRLGLVTVALTIVYPFGKRFTHFAQVILGLTLATNFILAAYGTGLPALEPPYTIPTLFTTAAITLLVIFYDVIYARQDTLDDLKSGVKGMAVLFRNYIEVLLISIAVAVTGLLAAVGVAVDYGPYFFVFSVAGLYMTLLGIVGAIRYQLFHTWNHRSGWLYALAIANLLLGYSIEYLNSSDSKNIV
jgi:4-hydroxybenzoate polyprenyltransferase